MLAVAGIKGGGYLSDLYSIDPVTLVAKELFSLVQGTAPSPRMRLGFSVLDGTIYVYGGLDGTGLLSDMKGLAIPRRIPLSPVSPLSFFLQLYDWDTLIAPGEPAQIPQRLILCSGSLPCSVTIMGEQDNEVRLVEQGSVACRASSGCTSLVLDSLRVICAAAAGMSPFDIQGAHLHVSNTSFHSCSSLEDGGTLSAYQDAYLTIVGSTFRNSWSAGLGGAISLMGVYAILERVHFINCTAWQGGGAVSGSGFTLYGSLLPFQTDATMLACTFMACKSAFDGGAVLASSASASVMIAHSDFLDCEAGGVGGGIAAFESVSVTVKQSRFTNNAAKGLGGGAICATDSQFTANNITCLRNIAPSGGGGAILWSGDDPPHIDLGHRIVPLTGGDGWKGFNNLFVCIDNTAAYGPCVASAYSHLEVVQAPQSLHPAYPGLSFSLAVLKKDAYNQTIVIDSMSTLQMFPTIYTASLSDPSVSILGGTVAVLTHGRAEFFIAIKPTFTKISPCDDFSYLYSRPTLQIKGFDSITQHNMELQGFKVYLSNCTSVCPQGHILLLDQASTAGRQGACVPCSAGTYSLDPLAGSLEDPSTPACLKCPAGANCISGKSISSLAGQWTTSRSMYILESCPEGHQLINSTEGTSYGLFSHDIQQCRLCRDNQYLVDQRESCQICPTGATCNSTTGRLAGFEGSYWGREGDKMRVMGCDPGYILVRSDVHNGAVAFLDACVQCLPSTYSLTGSWISRNVTDPCVWTGAAGQPYTCAEISRADVVGFQDSSIPGAWTPNPDLAQQLCLKCPIGATCPGGFEVIPQAGYWTDNEKNISASRREFSLQIQPPTILILKCHPGSCEENGTCAKGHAGPVCALCERGWAMASNDCIKCPTDGKAYEVEKILVAIACSISAVVIYFFFSLRPLFKQDDEGPGNEEVEENAEQESNDDVPLDNVSGTNIMEVVGQWKVRVLEYFTDLDVLLFLQGYLKVLISFFQVLSTFAQNFSVGWPPNLYQLFQISTIIRFDMIALPGFNCLFVGFSYRIQLMMYTLFPLAGIFLLSITPCISMCISVTKSKLDAVWNQFWYSLMFLLFVIYPTVSVTTLRSFNCQRIGRYGWLLMADYSEACPYQEGQLLRSEKNFVFWWSAAFGILYPVGIPLLFLLIMQHYRVPEIAEAKIRVAKVGAMITQYRLRAMPLEVEILTRQLKLASILPCADLLEYRIGNLFDAVAQDKAVVTSSNLVDYLKNPLLGLPNPDEDVIQELFEAKDTSGDGKLDSCEFIEMMRQAMYVHELFTGHEELDDMNFDQLRRLYEFHANKKIYIEKCEGTLSQEGENGITGSLKAVAGSISDAIQHLGYSSRSKQDNIVDKLISSSNLPKEDIHAYLQDEIEYPGMEKFGVLEKKLPQELLSALQVKMIGDLKRKILTLADAKVASGAIVIHSIAWKASTRKSAQLTEIQRAEELAVQRLGFLMRNYDVRHWYYEIIEMIRKLLMTSIIVFIYSGSYVQVASALLISILAAVHVQFTRPFIDKKIGDTQAYSLLAHSLTLVYGLMLMFQEIYADLLRIEMPFAQQLLTRLFAALVVGINLSTIAFPFLASIFAALLAAASTSWLAHKCVKNKIQDPSRATDPDGLGGTTASRRRDSSLWSKSCLPLADEWPAPAEEEGVGAAGGQLRRYPSMRLRIRANSAQQGRSVRFAGEENAPRQPFAAPPAPSPRIQVCSRRSSSNYSDLNSKLCQYEEV